MKYKVINTKAYPVYVNRFMLLPGENIVTCTEMEAAIIASSNGSVVAPIGKAEAKEYPEIRKKKK